MYIVCYLDQKTDYLYCFRILGQTRVFSSTAFWATLSKSPGSASTRLQWAIQNYRPRKGPKFWRNHIWWIKKKRSFAHSVQDFGLLHTSWYDSIRSTSTNRRSWENLLQHLEVKAEQQIATGRFFVCGAPNHFNHHLPILLSLVVFPVDWDKTLSWLSNTSFWGRNHHFWLFTSLFLIIWFHH